MTIHSCNSSIFSLLLIYVSSRPSKSVIIYVTSVTILHFNCLETVALKNWFLFCTLFSLHSSTKHLVHVFCSIAELPIVTATYTIAIYILTVMVNWPGASLLTLMQYWTQYNIINSLVAESNFEALRYQSQPLDKILCQLHQHSSS